VCCTWVRQHTCLSTLTHTPPPFLSLSLSLSVTRFPQCTSDTTPSRDPPLPHHSCRVSLSVSVSLQLILPACLSVLIKSACVCVTCVCVTRTAFDAPPLPHWATLAWLNSLSHSLSCARPHRVIPVKSAHPPLSITNITCRDTFYPHESSIVSFVPPSFTDGVTDIFLIADSAAAPPLTNLN